MTLYDAIGGEASIEAALESFYPKILADARINFLFKDVEMERLKRHSQAFLAAALGGPNRYAGRGLRSAHRRAVAQGLNDTHFEVFMGHLRATLRELGLPSERINAILAVAEQGREEVLNH